MPAQLEDLQGFLAGAFQRREPVEGDSALSAACAEHVTGNERLTPAEQVDIYRRQFWLRHRDSLEDDHPALLHVLGDDAFDAFCWAYLAAHPPRTPSLRDLTADVVAFAEGYGGFPPGRREIAVDMVRYEHAFVEMFDGPDTPPVTAAKLQALPEAAWARARIVLHPLLVWMKLSYPVHEIRYAVKDKKAPEVPASPSPEPIHVAVFRKDLVIHYEELTPRAFELLGLLSSGVALVPAMNRIAEGAGDAEARELEAAVGTWFRQWAAWGWIVDVALPLICG